MSAKANKKFRTSHRECCSWSARMHRFLFVEAYKSLRTNLEFLSTTSNCKTILITSSVPEEGKSNVAVNLAITLAASNKRVVLVDCDMRKSAISRYHAHSPQPGRSDKRHYRARRHHPRRMHCCA